MSNIIVDKGKRIQFLIVLASILVEVTFLNSENVYATETYKFVRLWPDKVWFSFPSNIAIDSSGYVYVVDSGNDRIQKFTSAGVYLTQWGVQPTAQMTGSSTIPIV